MNKRSFDKLEKALRARRPNLAKALQPGLPEALVTDILKRAKVGKNVHAVVALYSWKNGADTTKARQAFFPESIYQFLPLDAALEQCTAVQRAVNALTELGSPIELPREAGRYLPVFWDGVTAFLAIDLEPSKSNRVMEIEFESAEPFREVCDSFESFLADATKAIEENKALSCIQ